jgi:hypothetical protein
MYKTQFWFCLFGFFSPGDSRFCLRRPIFTVYNRRWHKQ